MFRKVLRAWPTLAKNLMCRWIFSRARSWRASLSPCRSTITIVSSIRVRALAVPEGFTRDMHSFARSVRPFIAATHPMSATMSRLTFLALPFGLESILDQAERSSASILSSPFTSPDLTDCTATLAASSGLPEASALAPFPRVIER